jgi:hypothetical protein
MLVRTLALAALAAALPFGTQAAAQVGQCPNQRATNVDTEFGDSGTYDTCRDYVLILGLRITQNVSMCPMWTSMHPAHQECLGAPSVGTRCVFESTLAVLTRTCECQANGSPLFGSVVEDCVCDDPVEVGTLEDFQTLACIEVDPPRS